MQGIDPAMMQQGQLALSMMTPEQRKAAVEKALANATPEERAQLEQQQKAMHEKLEKAAPEERAAMAQQAHIMQDVGVFCRHLRPDGGDPNKVLGTVDVLGAMAECASFGALTQAIKNSAADQQKATIRAFLLLEKALMTSATEADAAALRETKAKPEQRRPLLLMLWILYKHKVGDAVALDETVSFYYDATKRLATQLLMQAQMVLPQQRWVQQTLAVSRVSALLVNELWSHDDLECRARMRDILAPPDKGAEEHMPYPVLSLRSRTVLALAHDAGLTGKLSELTASGEALPPCECLPGQMVAVEVELERLHAGAGATPTDIGDAKSNPKGILEAYWCYIEGHTPNGQAHTLLAAQPLAVTDLETKVLKTISKFEAPKEAGTYDVTVHIASTSVVGCDQQMRLQFIVKEDDVPALE